MTEPIGGQSRGRLGPVREPFDEFIDRELRKMRKCVACIQVLLARARELLNSVAALSKETPPEGLLDGTAIEL